MTFLDILYIAVPAIVLIAFFYYWFFVRRYWRYRFRSNPFETLDRHIRNKGSSDWDEMRHYIIRNLDLTERHMPRLLEELPFRVEMQLTKLLDRKLHETLESFRKTLTEETRAVLLDRELGQALEPPPETQTKRIKEEDLRQSSTKQLIRELGHSLNTPLSQIEASVLALRAQSTKPMVDSINLRASLGRISASLDICKSVIAAFRELVVVTSSSSIWSPSSIPKALRAASDVYMKSFSKQLDVELNMPEEIQGYSSNFIVALTLPLLENAIEAGQDNEKITIFGQKKGQSFEIIVTNHLHEPLPNDDMYEPGFTTKKGHDGVGLSTVRHLLSGLRGAHVDHSADKNEVSFRVTLPARE